MAIYHCSVRTFSRSEGHSAVAASGGVTTVVMGNCGVGAAPCRKEDRDFMVHLVRLNRQTCWSAH